MSNIRNEGNMFHYLCTGFKQKQITRGSYSLCSLAMSTVSEYQEFYKQNIFHTDLICKKCKSECRAGTSKQVISVNGGNLYIAWLLCWASSLDDQWMSDLYLPRLWKNWVPLVKNMIFNTIYWESMISCHCHIQNLRCQ